MIKVLFLNDFTDSQRRDAPETATLFRFRGASGKRECRFFAAACSDLDRHAGHLAL